MSLAGSMIELEPITSENALIFKAVRLRALEDTPSAFGSTYAKEFQFPDAEWLRRATNMNGESSVGFLAMDKGAACGIAACFLNQTNCVQAQLISMWTAPTHRQQGVGRLLVNGILDWARQRKVCELRLMVTSNNGPAIRFYERLGFSKTGRTEPYPNDPGLIEYEMSLLIA